MKIKNVEINIRSLSSVLEEFGKTYEKIKKGETIPKKNELSFPTLAVMQSALTEKRLALLQIIKKEEPSSVYELAKKAKRDLKNVKEDLEKLHTLGLVSLKKSKEGRKNTTPSVQYDKIHIEISI